MGVTLESDSLLLDLQEQVPALHKEIYANLWECSTEVA